MVSVAPEDRDVLRFLWVDDIQKEVPQVVTLRFKRVIFGVSCSLFLLNATIYHHLLQYQPEDPPFCTQVFVINLCRRFGVWCINNR